MAKKHPRAYHKWILLAGVVAAILAAFGFGAYNLMNSRTFQVFGGLTDRVNTDEKVVALTLDDGPTRGYTENILEILKAEDVKATFFLIGDNMRKDPDLGKKIVDAGHQVGNHSYTHQHMVMRSRTFYKNEIERTDAEIRKAGYQGEIVFRPPFGKKLFGLPLYLADHSRKTIMWDIEPETVDGIGHDSEGMAAYTAKHAKPGSIIIYHAMYQGRQPSLLALKPTIKILKERGYKFVTVNQLLSSHK